MADVLTIEEAIQLGMGRSANCGAFSTGKVGGGNGTVFDLNQPELVIGIPAGLCIRPFSINVQVQPGVTTADSDEMECLIAVDSLGLWRGDGTNTVVNPSNLRSDLDKGSACRVAQAETGDLTTTPGYAVAAGAEPVLDMELDRMVKTANFGTNVGITEVQLDLKYAPKHPPYLVGPCSLFVYGGGTRATIGVFVQAQWVEGKISDFLPAIGSTH
jgi:hypothetical protein